MFLFLAILLNTLAYSYPELTRHGYTNCTACHYSTTGGGALTEYGRALSKETLSTFGNDNEESYAYSVKQMPAWIDAGGDFRYLYLYRDNPTLREGKSIFMQSDLEVIANYRKKIIASFTGGASEERIGDQRKARYTARKYYAKYTPNDELHIRAGKFHQAYGLNLPDHAVYIKRGLGRDESTETQNLELAYLGESQEHYLSYSLGRPEIIATAKEKSIAYSGAMHAFGNSKFGLDYFHGSSNDQNRNIFGMHGIWGITEKFYLMHELDFQWLKLLNSASSHGIVSFDKLGYEYLQGLVVFLQEEHSYLNLDNPNSRAESHGAGISWWPRPHWELGLFFAKQKSSSFDRRWTDMGYFLVHFYL